MSKTLEEIIAAPSLVREQWLSPELAVREVLAFERRFGSKHLMLACHAALPLILTPELLNLIHINFLDKAQIPWIAEADFLLSPLCRPIDEGLFEVEPSVREVLLVELENQFGWQRPFTLAKFFQFYLAQKPDRKQRSEVYRTQRWIAQAYIDPDRVIAELTDFIDSSLSEENNILNLQDKIQFITIMELIVDPLERTNLQTEYQYLANNSRVLMQIIYGDKQKLVQNIREEEAEEKIENKKSVLLSPIILKQLADINERPVVKEEVYNTIKQRIDESKLGAKLIQELAGEWRSRLLIDCPDQKSEIREEIIDWLLGEDLERFDTLSPSQLAIAKQAMDYRWQILQQRYLGVRSERAYRNLTARLGSLVMLRNKIRTWVALSRDRQRAVADVLQEVLQELLHSDRYMQQQIAWINRCTKDDQLKEALVLASLEEYCLRPIRNQPLLVYRFVNYLRRSGRSGMTHVPERDRVRLVSAEVNLDETDSPMNLLDSQAIAEYQDNQAWEDQLPVRTAVRREFETYLAENVSSQARDWLQFYLQGLSQEAIAKEMNLPIQQINRLQEKVSYHAVRVFALKTQPELVAAWLSLSLRENNLGLTPKQWQKFWETLTLQQCQLVEKLKAGCPLEAIAKDMGLKTHQVMGEWSKLYLAAQALRSDY